MTEELNGTMVPMTDDVDGTVVPSTEVNLAEGQNDQSIQDTNASENEVNVCVAKEGDSIQSEMLQGIKPWSQPKGCSEVLIQDDSSDVGSQDVQEVLVDLRDGDPAWADLQPGHLVINKRDRRMMMNGHESDYAQTTRRLRAEHAGDRAPMPGSMVNHGWREGSQESCHPPRTSRSGQFGSTGKSDGCNLKPGQPGYCCSHFPGRIYLYGLDLTALAGPHCKSLPL